MPSSPESSDNEMCTDISRSAPSPSSWAPGTDGTPEAGRRCPPWDILPRRLARTGPGLLSTSPQLRREAPRPEPGGSGSGNGGARWKVGRSHRGRASRGPCTAIKEGHSQGQWTSGHTSQECQGKRKSQRPCVLAKNVPSPKRTNGKGEPSLPKTNTQRFASRALECNVGIGPNGG